MSKFLPKLSQNIGGHSGGSIQNNKYTDRLILFGGVILPLIAVMFEVTTHFCAHHFFDPFPSTNHVLLFLLIPISNFLALLARHNNLSDHYATMALMNGMAGGVAIIYSLMFLPIVGFSLVFTIALGFGLLGLAPLIAIPCTMGGGRIITRLAHGKTYFDPHQVEHFGHLIILVMVVAIELPSTLTRYHLEQAEGGPQSKDAIKWLRENGNNEVMLRACYERSGRATDILGSLYESAHPISVDHARKIYYQVTGQPFNTVSLPAGARATISHAGLVTDIAGVNKKVEDEFDLDADIAGETVSGQARGLSLANCAINGKVDADGLLENLSWTFDFINKSKYDREARAKLLLPPHAVVTGATLIVDNVQHPAEIMLRKKARLVYTQAVASQRNPLLISTCGPDEVLMQCFPVPPARPLRIELSLACPLSYIDEGSAAIPFPTIMDKNFAQTGPVSIDLSSSQKLTAIDPGLAANGQAKPTISTDAAYAADGSNSISKLNGSVEVSSMDTLKSLVHAARDPQCKTAFCKDRFDGKTIVERRIAEESYKAPGKLLIIVDGSKCMIAYADEIAKGLRALPADLPVELRLIGDRTVTLFAGTREALQSKFVEALARLHNAEFIGGQDDSLALLYLTKRAAAEPNTAVLWIHGAQPIATAKTETLRGVLRSESDRPLVYDFHVCAGPCEILNGIYSSHSFVRVGRSAEISKDLERLYRSWKSPTNAPEFASFPYHVDVDLDGRPTFESLAQVYANGLILDDVNKFDSIDQVVENSQATHLAYTYHLVTPVSSAVVNTFGKDAADRKVETGVAPEADTWLLLLIAGGLILACVRNQKRKIEMVRT